MAEETLFGAIRRLQQKMDRIDDQIVSKRQTIRDKNFTGPLKRLIESEISVLLDRHEAIRRNILQLKKIEPQTIK